MSTKTENASDRLVASLRHDEELVAVIRGHLYLESQLNRLIDTLLPFPDQISDSRLGWPQRVDLALALGLEDRYGPPLRKMGKIRNLFAHDPSCGLDDSDVRALYDSLAKEDKDVVLLSFSITKDKMPDVGAKSFALLSIRDRFTLIVVALHALLGTAVAEATIRKN